MLILGVILLVIGFLLGIQLVWILGVILAVVGAVLAITGTVGHRPIGGRSWWY